MRPTIFFKDTKRLNVALSRAKRELIILGKIGYFYKFKTDESCLPAFANYIKENGNVIMADKCELLSERMYATKAEELLLSINAISLPTAFYTQEYDKRVVRDKINEYYKNGDFIHPLIIEQESSGYILKDNFEQYRAAQELGVEECLCLLV